MKQNGGMALRWHNGPICIANGKMSYAVLLDCREMVHELIEIPKTIEIVVLKQI